MVSRNRSIIQLDKKTVNKIAAGEVVERPSSVVKELVENAIDAQATEITIQIKGYGLEEIRVMDNGIGMSREDANIAWREHTTSKLRTIDDLNSLFSLGFRGEALASIASVSVLEILTKPRSQSTGTFIRVKGGELEKTEERECAPGTAISVKNLFFNVPARRKFLKSRTTELGHIIDVATRQALIHPEIHFKLMHEATILLHSPKSDNPLDPFIEIFGVEDAKKMLPINYSDEGLEITGFTSFPELSRSTRDFEFFYVNKRHVRSRLLSEAVEEAYKSLLMKHRYPVVLLNLAIDPSQIDVNIHPTKREIRFDDTKKIFGLVTKAISAALSSKELWREMSALKKRQEPAASEVKQVLLPFTPLKESATPIKAPSEITAVPSQSERQSIHAPAPNLELRFKPGDKQQQQQQLKTASTMVKFSETFWIKPLGQALKLYALCETHAGIAIVDIHAAHERIRYEELLRRYKKAKIKQQELLQPITFSLTTEQAAFLQEYLDHFKAIGLLPEKFGGNTYILRSLPVIMDLTLTEEDITNLIEEVRLEIPKLSTLNARIDLLLKTMACHSAVRGGDAITTEKIAEILRLLSACEKPYTCPHGRPTIIKISEKALEKEFSRIV
ncbi:MAG: DNA mismatch repair endonuclease MutL [Candidatus Gerdarchaeota archaeon]|nr:MAG: DNA mismatch repair endonuclease MutL [Candidatus Gerdarchaeota archaeon]